MVEVKRCDICKFNIKHIANNLYKCHNCGYLLINKDNSNSESFVPIIDTDMRRCEIRWSDGRRDVYTKLYQLDLLNFYNYAIQRNNNFYSIKIERFIKQIDKLLNQNTDFNRQLPRLFLTRLTGEDDY